eukprot:Skav205712  [mRNA]  locus=scaffold608:43274:44422:- [translate_table: standard]
MPIPYPSVWSSESWPSVLEAGDRSRKKAVNLVVLALGWLEMKRPLKAPSSMALGARLSRAQWLVVRRLERALEDVASSGDIDAKAMGRTAAKVEGLDDMLHVLEEQARELKVSFYEQKFKAQLSSSTKSVLAPGHQLTDPGVVVGKLKKGSPALAKPLDADRLSLPMEPPSFDPSDLLAEPHRTVFKDPVSKAIAPGDSMKTPPKVRLHANPDQAWSFLQLLDRRHRLTLAPAEKVRESHLAGAFGLVKDLEKDRLIIDARPANELEATLNTWTRTMGSVQAFLQHEIFPGYCMYFSGTDLKDFYYAFRITSRRAHRNALKYALTQAQAKRFQCYTDELQHSSVLYPCLSTMAMGDNNAVELGQCSHLNIGLQVGAIHPVNC